ncbi:hypothetical protein [Dyella choica]|uniref:Uncharacterized protein n=1 Tax=Dyella choica TaxID=1927959 RepID=A0A432MB13_9GAMM|nr:hypothetical protein [Dyella choica]RUL79935.1 hypothetical protein EKH80_01720 [Dyella choica]
MSHRFQKLGLGAAILFGLCSHVSAQGRVACDASGGYSTCTAMQLPTTSSELYPDFANNGVMHGNSNRTINVHFILYGSWYYDVSGLGMYYQDPQVNLMQHFIVDANNSQWLSGVADYFDQASSAATTLSLGSTVVDGLANYGFSNTAPSQGFQIQDSTPTASSIIKILTRALTTSLDYNSSGNYHGTLPTDRTALYVIVGKGSSINNPVVNTVSAVNIGGGNTYLLGGSNGQECAYHASTKYAYYVGSDNGTNQGLNAQSEVFINGQNIHYIYISDPASNPSLCASGYSASGPSPNGSVSGDAMVNLLAHELVESITDPHSFSTGGPSTGIIWPTIGAQGSGAWITEIPHYYNNTTDQAVGGYATRVSWQGGEIADLCMSSSNLTAFPNVAYVPPGQPNAGAPYNVIARSGMHYLVQAYGRAFDGTCHMGHLPDGTNSSF